MSKPRNGYEFKRFRHGPLAHAQPAQPDRGALRRDATLGKVAVDVKKHKAPTREEGAAPTLVDYGAGRLVHVNVLGVRLAADHEKNEIAMRQKK